jgi:hypothetical protein
MGDDKKILEYESLKPRRRKWRIWDFPYWLGPIWAFGSIALLLFIGDPDTGIVRRILSVLIVSCEAFASFLCLANGSNALRSSSHFKHVVIALFFGVNFTLLFMFLMATFAML